jgi:cytochrome c oxidase cbb3-type subunit III
VSQSEPTQDKVVHVYDDIEEEDNRLPNWWVAILIGSIVFSFGYWFVYHTAKLRPQPREVYEQRVAALLEARIAANPTSPEAIVALSRDPEAMAVGAEVFRTTCAACHGLQGEGVIGPNLTDRYWIHGNRPEDLLKAVTEGFVSKGMPAWGPMIGPERSIRVAAYVITLRDTDVPGKEPQGEPVD